MSIFKKISKTVAILVIILAESHYANSATIQSVSTSGSTNGDISNISINDNVVTLDKEFKKNGSIDINIILEPNRISEKLIFLEKVTNNTGIIWKDYHLELLTFQSEDNPRTFGPKPSIPDDGLNFDKTPMPTANQSFSNNLILPAFDSLTTLTEDRLDWDGGNIGSTPPVQFSFVINVSKSIEQQAFVIRQTPSPVPEPSSVVGTLVFFAFGTGTILKHKLKQKKVV